MTTLFATIAGRHASMTVDDVTTEYIMRVIQMVANHEWPYIYKEGWAETLEFYQMALEIHKL